QFGEAMLNYKSNSHRGRFPSTYSDSLCIVEVEIKIVKPILQ
ncbi:hypothetical protein H312_00619, partial [Anncaliia algerae PRA339]